MTIKHNNGNLMSIILNNQLYVPFFFSHNIIEILPIYVTIMIVFKTIDNQCLTIVIILFSLLLRPSTCMYTQLTMYIGLVFMYITILHNSNKSCIAMEYLFVYNYGQ